MTPARELNRCRYVLRHLRIGSDVLYRSFYGVCSTAPEYIAGSAGAGFDGLAWFSINPCRAAGGTPRVEALWLLLRRAVITMFPSIVNILPDGMMDKKR